MKKFLSLLLTLTMVLSLAVVPARAGNGDGEDTGSGSGSGSETPATTPVAFSWTEPTMSILCNSTEVTSATKVKIGDSLTFTVSNLAVKKDSNDAVLDTDYRVEYRWSGVTNGSSSGNSATVTAGAAGPLSVSCTVIVTPIPGEGHTANPTELSKAITGNVTVIDPTAEANAAFKTAVLASAKFAYNGRPYTYANDKVTAYKYSDDGAKNEWTINADALATALSKDYTDVNVGSASGDKITVSAKTKVTEGTPIEVSFDIALEVKTASFGIKATIDGQVTANTIIAGGKVKLETESVNLPAGVTYEWTYGTDGKITNPSAWSPAETATVKCIAYTGSNESKVKVAESNSLPITVIADIWGLFASSDSLKAINLAPGQSATLPTDILLYAKDSNGNKTGDAISASAAKYDWSYTSSALEVKDGKVYVKTGASSNTYILTRTATYQGKTYKQNISIVVSSLSYELDPVVNGDSKSYSVNTLASYARSRIASRLNESASSITVNSLTVKSRNPLTGGAFSTNANVGTTFNRSSGSTISGSFTYSASKTTLGYASIVMTVETNRGSFDVTYSIPVIPISRAFEAQYPQVSTSGSNYIYTVSAPSGFDRIYVINKTGATPTTSQLTTMPSGAASVSLSASDFNSATGKCTLYIMAWNSNYSNYSSSSSSYGKYYYGTLEVYLQSNDIEYTGVAGSTVNFQHSSFTAFLNAMNVSTSTDYYEFQDVTFTYFNSTTQGTLYYGSTAMTSGTYNSSSYFNSATKITNLDNVSFAIKSTIPSTIKTISIPFQLHAKQYRSGTYSSTFVRDVTFSGRVVISVAREDVVINVAAGDAVKLDATAFLTYLRNSSTSYRNANIDYVTFSQNLSVSSSNSAYANGALYTYYTNSYSFGNPVTSTDRFYYNPTTYNVNRLSDVAFRANAYASAGTTVYIPFTIKLLNSNATVTGTLAAKIANAVNFYDVAPGAYYYDAVKWAVGAGVTKGTGNNMFSPAKSCTRAEIVTFLWRAAKSPAPKSYSNPFTDVYSGMGSDFYNAILWAVGEGITTGTTTSKFSPNDTCTRGQIVTFLHRYLKTPSGYYSNPFKDVKSGYYCYNAVIWAYGSGVAKGSSATTFSPDATCTRGDAVTFLYRALVK